MTTPCGDAPSCPFVPVVPLTAKDLVAIFVSSGTTPAEQAASDIDDEHHEHEDERRRPGQLDLGFERHAREVVDQDGQRRGGPHEAELAVLEQPVIAEER